MFNRKQFSNDMTKEKSLKIISKIGDISILMLPIFLIIDIWVGNEKIIKTDLVIIISMIVFYSILSKNK